MKTFASSRVRSAKKLLAIATLTVGVGLGFSVPVQAQIVPVPCAVYLCMAGMSGVGVADGPSCATAVPYWHAVAPLGLAVYDEFGFDPVASYALREGYMLACIGSEDATNAAIFEAIMTEWGSEP